MKKTIIAAAIVLSLSSIGCATALRKGADVVGAIGAVAPAVLNRAADISEEAESNGGSLWGAVKGVFKSED